MLTYETAAILCIASFGVGGVGGIAYAAALWCRKVIERDREISRLQDLAEERIERREQDRLQDLLSGAGSG
jgi:hypothetical protein